MYRPPESPQPRPGMSRIDALVASLLLLTIALLMPGCVRRVHTASSRGQSVNNLKQIVLAMQGFNDANKRLPFNGTKDAIGDDVRSGSWAFQILPYIDQGPMFKTGPDRPGVRAEVIGAYLCPQRCRQLVEKDRGAWTDYFINNYVNDPKNASKPNNADTKVTMASIKDGTSNTVFAAQGNISTRDYEKERGVTGSTNIFAGGQAGTMRAGTDWRPGTAPFASMLRDSADPPDLANGGWGGPFPQGALMGMGDGTVRMFPYAMSGTVFGAFLTPNGDEKVELPDT
jgi:type II secretory pathway pseudopilin PulG